MRKWEDIVKDKLEEPDGTLPESVFAEFRSRREAAAAAPHRFPWVWVTVPAVAAALAAVLFLRHPSVPTEGIQIVPQPTEPVAVVTEIPDSVEVADVTKAAKPARSRADGKTAEVIEAVEMVETVEEKTEEKADETRPTIVPQPAEPVVSAFPSAGLPMQPAATRKMKVGPAAGIVAGGGALATVLSSALKSGNAASGGKGPFTGPQDKLLDTKHYIPIKLGISTWISVSDNWFVSTGLNYSLYLSTFNYKIEGKKTQAAHYLGIPVKMNWVFASSPRFDVYLGGGLEADKCLGADGFSLSLQGAGGLQLNLSRRLGLYLEPELSWRIPMGTPVLETYRSQHPLVFTVAGGLRIRINN